MNKKQSYWQSSICLHVLATCLTMLMACGCSRDDKPAGPDRDAQRKNTRVMDGVPKFEVHFSAVQENLQLSFDEADLRILFVGNSHTRVSPNLLGQLFGILQPEKKVLIARSSGGFLVEHAESKFTLDMLGLGPWDFVILQGQKYSTSGKYSYPIDGALKLAGLAEKSGAKVILFPEWSREDHPDEYHRINKIHEQIARQTEANVAPIGQCWIEVAKKYPDLILYEPDGNHATDVGHFINACIFYNMINQSCKAFRLETEAKQFELENQISKVVAEFMSATDQR